MADDTFKTPQTTQVDYSSGKLDTAHKWTPDSINATAKQLTKLALGGQHDMVNHLVTNPGALQAYHNSGFQQLPQVPAPTGNQPVTPSEYGYQPIGTQINPSAQPASGDGGSVGANLFRAQVYGPAVGENWRDAVEGPLGKLTQGDIAVSPNMIGRYPLWSYVNIVDGSGNILRSNMRVADYSYKSPGNANSNTFEVWNEPSELGHANLVPVQGSNTPAQRSNTPAPAAATNTSNTSGGDTLEQTLNKAQQALRLNTGNLDDPRIDPNQTVASLQNATQGD